ncbi:MAG: GyrI-like domain-containing protein [Bacteroidota bacterium]
MKLSAPQLIKLPPIRLIGLKCETCLAEDTTAPLIRDFIAQRHRIKHTVNDFVHSMRVYPVGLEWPSFNVHTKFTKWAAIEVTEDAPCPEGFSVYVCTGGLYACFEHVGPAVEAPQVFTFIMRKWLPQTDFVVADRPHLERMELGYNPSDPLAKEEFWIPLKNEKVPMMARKATSHLALV